MNKKVECLIRYSFLSGTFDSIKHFLLDEKIVHKDLFTNKSVSRDIAETMYLSLKKAVENEEIQLVDFFWQILPVEQIRITITTSRTHREFTA